MKGRLTTSQAASAPRKSFPKSRMRPARRHSSSQGPRRMTGKNFAAIARPSTTPAQVGMRRAHSRIAPMVSPTGMRSQLMRPARMIVGARAIIAASQGLARTIRALATIASRKNGKSRIALTTKNVSAGATPGTMPMTTPVIHAAICMKTPVSTGYSR